MPVGNYLICDEYLSTLTHIIGFLKTVFKLNMNNVQTHNNIWYSIISIIQELWIHKYLTYQDSQENLRWQQTTFIIDN